MRMITVMEVREPGGPDALQAARRPLPAPGPGEALVRAQAIGVSSADLRVRQGVYHWMPPLPAVIGNELAGIVEAVGEGVTQVRPGMRVLVSARELPWRGGCYAQAVCVPAQAVFPLPDTIRATDAVSLPNYQLAGALLLESGVARPRSIAVYGAAGGVGLALLQLAQALGIQAIGIASSADKQAYARAAGIQDVISRDDTLAARVRTLTNGRGVDVVYAHAGPTLIDNLDLLAPLGTVVSFSHLGGFMPSADFYGALRDRLGLSLGIRVYSIHTLDDAPDTRRRLMTDAIAWMANGTIQPPPPHRMPLSQAAAAHARLEARATLGKIVLIPDDDFVRDAAAT